MFKNLHLWSWSPQTDYPLENLKSRHTVYEKPNCTIFAYSKCWTTARSPRCPAPDYKPTLFRTLRPYGHGLLIVRNQYPGHSLIVSLNSPTILYIWPRHNRVFDNSSLSQPFPEFSRGGPEAEGKQPHQNKMMASTRRSKLTLEVDHHHAAACPPKSCGFAMGKGKNKGFKEKVGQMDWYGQPQSQPNIFNPILALFNPAL